MRYKFLIGLFFGLVSLGSAQSDIPAFPGAEGFGAFTPGGRGGKVFIVTTLQDYLPGVEEPIPGSFRLACESSGPRIVIFKISGTIELKYPVWIKNSYISIFGQTAPGDGICLKNYSLVIAGDRSVGPVHDVVIQYLRVRPGDLRETIESKAPPRNDGSLTGNDGIGIHYAERVIIDHCSVSWGVDEVLEMTGNCKDITVQWCLVAEGLHNSTNFKGAHSKGLMVAYNCTNISLHHNLIMHSADRNPYLPAEYEDPFIIDMVNNVVYNWWVNPGISYGKTNHNGMINFVGNYYIPGINSWTKHSLNLGVDTRVYAKGNIGPYRKSDTQDEFVAVDWFGPEERKGLKSGKRFEAPLVTTTGWEEAYHDIIHFAGAIMPVRDATDHRLIEELKSRKGRIIDHPSQVGGWPELNSVLPGKDMDGDGIPDEWELSAGLDPSDPEDAGKLINGYSNIERWVQSIQEQSEINLTDTGLPGSGSEDSPVIVPYRDIAVRVDGRLDEWKDVPSMPLLYKNKPVSSTRFFWTDQGLYGSVAVKDSMLLLYENDPYWGDCFELFIEKDNAKAETREETRNAFQIIFSPTEDFISGPCNINIPRNWPKQGTEFIFGAWRKTMDGYVIEFVLDYYFFRPDQLKPGKKIGLNFAVINDRIAVEEFYGDKGVIGFFPAKWGTVELGE